MHKNSSPQSGHFNPRLAFAVILCLIGASFGWLTFAANPSSGTITPTSTNVTWNGTATAPTGGGESSCMEGLSCDSFKLTISGTPADWIAAHKGVHVQINWVSPSSDYDLYVHKGSLSGPVVASSGSAGTLSEQVDLNPASSSIGTGDFVVHVVYFAATAADQYSGVASVYSSGAPPIPAPTPAAPNAQRFETFNPPAAGPNTLGRSAGEPSIGVGLPITGHPEGRALFQADVQTLRVTFNGCLTPTWENKPAPTSQQDFDPILWTDRVTGRTVVHLLTFAGNVLAGESSVTDTAPPFNDGDTYAPSQGAGIASGIDHQTVGGGPYKENTVPPPPPQPRAYPRAVYYCSQALVDASCARSDDGGITYGPSVIVYTDQCGGLHGHVKVSPDGTVYLPNNSCGTEQAVAVSENNGATWNIRKIPGSVSGSSDPSVSVDANNKVYFGYAHGNTIAAITTSTDQGRTWSQPYDVGATFGINNLVFPAVIAGDSGRSAFAFLGTPTAGGLQGRGFTGVWHLYVATTLDGGGTWNTIDATPNDPVQRGCIWLAGGANVCRNMLDFMDAQLDQQGRVLVGYADGCAGAECAQAPQNSVGNSYTALATITRQSGGPRLLSAFDPPATATAPGTPKLTAQRNGNVVHLSWSLADNGGSPVTSYTILSGTASGNEATLVTVPGTQTRFDDHVGTNTATLFYRIIATNAQGSSCGETEISVNYVGASTDPNGFTVAADPINDQVGGPAGNRDLDIVSLGVSEPASGPLAGKLVFKLRIADLSVIPNERMWRIVWNSPSSPGQQFYVGMTKDQNGTVTYDYGTVATATVGLVLGLPSTTRIGTPDFGTYEPIANGYITIAVSKEKVGNPRPGDLLGAMSGRTYANVGNEIRSTTAADTTANANANDNTANAATYLVTGPVPGVVGAVSRKTHADAGTFDIDLPLAGAVVSEPRQGPTAGTHQIVITFANPLTNVGGVSASAISNGNSVPVTSSGSVGADPHEYIVNLTGVPNASTVTINVSGAVDNLGNAITSLPIQMAVLLGDANGDLAVNSADATVVRNRSGQLTDGGNFRSDVNCDGVVNSADATVVRNRSGTSSTGTAQPGRMQ